MTGVDRGSVDRLAWTEPGAFRVADGVHRIPLPLPMDGLRAVNVYAIETEQGLTLVDGGWAIEVAWSLLLESLESIGRRVEDITRILVTHAHRDHYTQAVAIRRAVGAHVSLGLGDKATLELVGSGSDRDPSADQLRRAGAADVARAWEAYSRSAERPPTSDWELPDAWLEGDHAVRVGSRTLEAVSTPGHTQGHFVFADREAGLLFAGDHVLPTITPSIGFEPAYAAQPLGDFLTSLAKVRALPDLQLLPAHGPVTGSSHARVEELVAHHDQRLSACLASVTSGRRTAREVAEDLPWTRRETPFAQLDVFNTGLATMETMAHLELLAARGQVARTESDGDSVREYVAAARVPRA